MNQEIMSRIIKSVIVIFIAIIIYIILEILVKKINKKFIIEQSKSNKKKTYIILINNTIRYFLLIVVLLILLEINGINISSLVTGLGVIGIIVGLAIQDALKDMIMGKNILSGHFFEVGDVIKYNDRVGKVIYMGLKFTKIRDVYTNDIISITNRNIEKVINVSDWLDIDVPTPYEENVDKMKNIFENIARKIKTIDNTKDCSSEGINEFEASSIIYKIRIYCQPENIPVIKRKALEIIKRELDDNNIPIPYQQIDIHMNSK